MKRSAKQKRVTATTNFAIPPGDPSYRVDTKLMLQDDAKLVNMLPHMHFRGKSFEYRVNYPSGEKETLLSVPHYDFNWQLTYELAEPKLLPKGPNARTGLRKSCLSP